MGELMEKMIAKLFKGINLLVMVIVLFMVLSSEKRALSYNFFDWYEGYPGYEMALMDAEEEQEPLILYFYLDPDEWSEKMYKDYLADYTVTEYLADIPKAALNLTGEGEEVELAKKMGVENCPAFVISIPSLNSEPRRIHPFSEKHNMNVEEFLSSIKEYIAYNYNNKAYEYFDKKDYDNSIVYFQKAVMFAPESAYSYHAIAVVYQMMAERKNDPSLLKTAEENYIKALKINPGLKEAEEELKALRDRMKKRNVK